MNDEHISDGQHIDHLDKRLISLKDGFAALGVADDIEEVLGRIHQPGWTTLIDVTFVHGLLDAVERSLDNVQALRTTLVEGARMISDRGYDGPLGGPPAGHTGGGYGDARG